MSETRTSTLVDSVYSCRRCVDKPERFASLFQLVTLPDSSSYPKKFPPIIGAQGRADLLFMGISPRLQKNYVLDWAMNDEHQFMTLSTNLDQYGINYLESYRLGTDDDKREDHYRPYIQMVETIYPTGTAFSRVAAVTDLYHCAYPAKDRNSHEPNHVALRWNSPCADSFFKRVFAQVQPKVIITRGAPPMDYFLKRFAGRRERATPDDRMNYSVAIDGVTTTIVSVRRASAAGFSKEDRRWAVDRIRDVLTQDQTSIYSCWQSAGELALNRQSENVISWTEKLPSGELVMMTEKRNGDIWMYRLDGSNTIVSMENASESGLSEPRQ